MAPSHRAADDGERQEYGAGDRTGTGAGHDTGSDRDISADRGREERPWRTKDDEPRPKRRGSLLRETIIIVACVLLISWILQTFVGRQYVIPSESMEPTLIGCQGCTNDRIIVDKLSYRFGDPEPGDVIVFKVPDAWDGGWVSPRSSNPVMRAVQDGLSWFGFAPPDENDYVKRVIATGGQTVECRNADGQGVKVNGRVLNEPYVDLELQQRNVFVDRTGDPSAVTPDGKLNACLGADFGPVTVPQGSVFVLGDNRTRSADSRFHLNTNNGAIPVSNIRGETRVVVYPFSRIGGVGSVDPQP